MNYTSPMPPTNGILHMDFIGRQVQAKSRSALTRQNTQQATVGTATSGQVAVPGIPGAAYVTRQIPGCRPTNLIIQDPTNILKTTYPPGANIPIVMGAPGTKPRLPTNLPTPGGGSGQPSNPTGPIVPGTPGSGPYYPPSYPAGGLIGNRANINCDVFDSGYGGCLINGADLRAAINACLGGPCNAQVIRATLRVSYQSFAGAGIINPFDSTPQSGQGDADNYCYIVDAKKNPNYAELKEVDKRFALFIVRCFEGNSLMEIDCEPTTEPIKLFGKASAWPLDSAHTGRIKVTLMAATYIITAIPPSYYRSPINFDFTADSYGWIGTGWLAGIGITPFFNTQFPHALYITGGIHTVTTIGAEGIYGQYAISPGFNCYTGGSAPITEVSPAEVTGPDSNGNFTKVQHLSIGDGFYGVGIGGTLGRCRSLNIG